MAVAAVLLAACRGQDTLGAERRIPLADSVPNGATLAVDSAGLAWIGRPGLLTAVDTTGRVVATVQTPGRAVPRVLWRGGGRLLIAAGARPATGNAAGGPARGGWSSPTTRALARDPRGEWVFAANRRGGVVGLDAATLAPRWGWPETGAEAVGMAVSPLGDRVYVSVAAASDEVGPTVQVRDAASGRVLFRADQPEPLRSLVMTDDGAMFGVAGGAVVRLRHQREALPRLWAERPGVGGSDDSVQIRVDPAGGRVAVFGRGRGARLALLNAETGAREGRTTTAPLDAAWGVGGRLYLLESRAVRVVR